MKTTEAGKRQQREIRSGLVQLAMRDLWAEKAPEMANAVQSRIASILATHVSRVRRGAIITYTLIVPELNRTYVRKVDTATEVQ